MPASDGGMTAVYNELLNKAGNTNAVDQSEHKRFINYSSATLVCLALMKYGTDAKVECDQGYGPTSAKWYTNCVSGVMDMSPETEWGKMWLSANCAYQRTMEHEAYDAGDVTHIVADHRVYYESVDGEHQLPPYTTNELLYFLKHAPFLSFSINPTDARLRINRGERVGDNIAIIANKSENTKTGDAQRETLSANDATRAYLSEIDSNCIQIAQLLPGCALRASESDLSKRIQLIKDSTMPGRMTVIVSLDVNGWPPNMNRKAAQEFHECSSIAGAPRRHANIADVCAEGARDNAVAKGVVPEF